MKSSLAVEQWWVHNHKANKYIGICASEWVIVIDWDVFCNINSAKTKRTNIRANENASEWQLAQKIHHFACRLVVTRQIQCKKNSPAFLWSHRACEFKYWNKCFNEMKCELLICYWVNARTKLCECVCV